MKKSVVDEIYKELKKQILNQTFTTEVFSEMQLAEQFHVSKTPVREALNILCVEGFISRYPSYGYVLKNMTPMEYQDISEIRFILESGAAKIIIELCTDDEIRQLYDTLEAPEGAGFNIVNLNFHTKLGELTKNQSLYSEIKRMTEVMSRPGQYLSFKHKPEGNVWHEKIIEALLARDVEEAVRCIKRDLVYIARNETADAEALSGRDENAKA